jgi:hypothetical protein
MKRVLAIAASALSLVLAASSAASASAAADRSGTEVIAGSTTNLAIIISNTTVVPVQASGVVNSVGTVPLSGPSNATSSLNFRAGKLTVHHKQTSSKQSTNLKTCVVSQAQGGVYTVVGGTGQFRGATGHGTFKVAFTITFPRLKNGKCNTSAKAVPVSGKISFLAFGPLSVK